MVAWSTMLISQAASSGLKHFLFKTADLDELLLDSRAIEFIYWIEFGRIIEFGMP